MADLDPALLILLLELTGVFLGRQLKAAHGSLLEAGFLDYIRLTV